MREREAEDPLLRSIHEFRATVDALSRVGVSRIAEVAYLRILVRKYPGHAAQFLAEHTGEAPAARPAAVPGGLPSASRPRRQRRGPVS